MCGGCHSSLHGGGGGEGGGYEGTLSYTAQEAKKRERGWDETGQTGTVAAMW